MTVLFFLGSYLKYQLVNKAIHSFWKRFTLLGSIIKHVLNQRDWLYSISNWKISYFSWHITNKIISFSKFPLNILKCYNVNPSSLSEFKFYSFHACITATFCLLTHVTGTEDRAEYFTADRLWMVVESTSVCTQPVQSCLTLYNFIDSVHGILQARILEWVAMTSSRVSSRRRDQTWVSCVSCITGGFFTYWDTSIENWANLVRRLFNKVGAYITILVNRY